MRARWLLCCWLAAAAAQDNRFDESGGERLCEPDPRGLSPYTEAPRSSPGHLRFQVPCRPPPDDAEGFVELGGLLTAGDVDNPLFNQYLAWDDGLLFNAAWRATSPDRTNYVELDARSLPSDRGRAALRGGRWGRYAYEATARRIEHRFTDAFPFLFDGAGTGELALPELLTPGLGPADAVRTVLLDRPPTRSQLRRDQLAVGLRHRVTPRTELHFSLLRERREGTRPTSGSNQFRSTSTGSLVHLLAPIDYLTHEVELGVNTQLGNWHVSARYDGSFFDNDSGELAWENPFPNSTRPDAFVVERGRLDLYPDNRQHRLRLDALRPLSGGGQWSASLSWLKLRQDDALLPHTLNSGRIDGPVPIDLDDWNTRASLSRTRADAAIDAVRVFTRGRGELREGLRWTAELSYYDEDNDTAYVNFNPLTGQYGALVQDGAFAANRPFDSGIFVPGEPGSNTLFRSIPFARSESRLALGLDGRIGRQTRWTARYRWGRESRAIGQVEDLREHSLEARLTRRIGERATGRLNLELGDRAGDDYVPFPYAPFYSASLPGYVPRFPAGDPPFTLPTLRNFDLADRRAARASGLVQVRVSDALDLSLSAQVSDAEYEAVDGLRGAVERGVNAELAWLPRPATRLSAYASYSQRDSDQSGVRDVRVAVDPAAVFPDDARWFVTHRDRDLALGLGLAQQLGPVTLELHYDYLDTRSEIQPRVASSLALSAAEDPAPADLAFPDIAFDRRVLEAQSLIPVRGGWSLRLYARFEEGELADWHSDGLEPVIGTQYLLPGRTGTFRSRVYGLLLRRALE